MRLDAGSGKEVWRQAIGEVFQDTFGNGPRATPTLDGKLLYIVGSRSVLHAIGTEDGEVAWSIDLKEKYGSDLPRFGYSASPVVEGDLLLLEVGGKEENSLVALNKKTGEARWAILSGGVGYSSPIVASFGGVRQVILPRGKTVTAVSMEGEVLWTFDMEEPVIAMPIVVGEDLKCVSVSSGEVMWVKRGFGKGSLIAVGDRLVILSGKGALVLLEATGAEYRELGSLQALEGKSWTAPSYAGGRVYLRNLTEMACLDLRG